MENKNTAVLAGRLLSFSQGKSMNKGMIEVERRSGVTDKLPFMTTKNLEGLEGSMLIMEGRLQTRNVIDKYGKSHKKTFVFVDEVYENKENLFLNEISVEGFIVHKDELRDTPKGKTIVDIVLAVNGYDGSQYPSCIVWGSSAEQISKLPIGSSVAASGRFQSREYQKETSKGIKIKTAYEVSIGYIREECV